MQPKISEEDFAFLGTIGAMIYLEGSDKYNAIIAAEQLLHKIRGASEIR
jgi:hypothetical protein